jgi:syntaxin 6
MLLDSCNTLTDVQFSTVSKRIRATLRQLKTDSSDLQKTITIVESHRTRFAHIDDAELASRRAFVTDVGATIDETEARLDSPQTRRKLDADKRIRSISALDGKTSSGGGGKRRGDDKAKSLLESKQQQQQLLERKQDVVLDDMSSALSRLTDMSTGINEELTTQGAMLSEFDDELDETASTMAGVQARLEKLLGTSDKGRLCCIFVLVLIVAALAWLVFYT